MVMSRITLNILCLIVLINFPAFSQIKYLAEDFEGFSDNQNTFPKEGIFTFGSVRAISEKTFTSGSGYSGDRALKIIRSGKEKFGGWGKGLSAFIELNSETDYFNFYIYSPAVNSKEEILIVSIEEDDNGNGTFESNNDDVWKHEIKIQPKDEWQLISLPLNSFKDSNNGGDGVFNVGYKSGKIFSVIFSFNDSIPVQQGKKFHFDFLCFSKGPLKTGAHIWSPPAADPEDFALLGAWSEEGNEGLFNMIAPTFENYFTKDKQKKLGVVHFFQPFASGKESEGIHYPSIEHIEEIISAGYIPMITLENHFVKVNKNHKQPNLYSITEGHFDYLFYEWADRLKNSSGVILLRILHEFNGDWYPWCVSKNDNNPELYISAFKRIVNIFREKNADNVKFIWCPNSMSIPQESWNYLMDAYPGDEYVDFTALDIYNGAGEKGVPLWRSFRKEAAESYYLLTSLLPHKPLLVCETASRERMPSETGALQSKADWIRQMGEALSADLSKIRLLTWFNEYNNFKINSSVNSKKAFSESIWQNDFFKSGGENFFHKTGFKR
jgi:hypothetical protein